MTSRSINAFLIVGAIVAALGIWIVFIKPEVGSGRSGGVITVVKSNAQKSPAWVAPAAIPSIISDEKHAANAPQEPERVDRSTALAPLLATLPTIRALHDRLRSEPRDNGWATMSERMLRHEFDRIVDVAGAKDDFTISCGSTLCEISGIEGPDKAANDIVNERIQSADVAAAFWSRGYQAAGTAFGAASDGRPVRLLYFQRSAPVNVKVRP